MQKLINYLKEVCLTSTIFVSKIESKNGIIILKLSKPDKQGYLTHKEFELNAVNPEINHVKSYMNKINEQKR